VTAGAYGGRTIRFGIREHAMGAMLNGIALHGGLRPFGSTFPVFSDYMRPSICLAALMKLPVIYVFTQVSIALRSPVGTLSCLTRARWCHSVLVI
jgi:transketolase